MPGLDVEKCEADYILEPGFSALVYRNGFCDDYQKSLDRLPYLRPTLEYLVLETRIGIHEWRGWDTAKQFKRRRDGFCFLRVDKRG